GGAGEQARRAPGPGGERAQLAPRTPLVAAARLPRRSRRRVRGARRGRSAAGRLRRRPVAEGGLGRPPGAGRRRAAVGAGRLAGRPRGRPGRQAGPGVPHHRHRRGRRGPGRGPPAPRPGRGLTVGRRGAETPLPPAGPYGRGAGRRTAGKRVSASGLPPPASATISSGVCSPRTREKTTPPLPSGAKPWTAGRGSEL